MKRLIAVVAAVAVLGAGTALATTVTPRTTNAGYHQYKPPVVCPNLKEIKTVQQLLYYIYLMKTGKCPVPPHPKPPLYNCKDKYGIPCKCDVKGARPWR
jgi:hypothetical protein